MAGYNRPMPESSPAPSDDPHALSAFVKSEAHRLGFDLVGITTPEPPQHLDTFRDWLARGMHGEMSYLATQRSVERRADPRLILPECRSIVVLGANYMPLNGAPGPDGPVSAYALGEDYHDVLPKRMEQLVAALETRLGRTFPYRTYTDTGPVLERDLGQRAGLGWIGKNTCLIHPQIGSYFFLAAVLVGVWLDPDPAFAHDRCGSCDRCITACPTECILPDRTLDARRCISYLTIELKGAIPLDLRSHMGGWIFGCDICQQVCPWNLRFARPTQDGTFQPSDFMQSFGIDHILGLSEERSRRALQGSPLRRARRSGMVRNAAVAAGNSDDQRLVTALVHLLHQDREPMIRSHAAWALGQLEDVEASRALGRAAREETEPTVQEEIQAALERFS